MFLGFFSLSGGKLILVFSFTPFRSGCSLASFASLFYLTYCKSWAKFLNFIILVIYLSGYSMAPVLFFILTHTLQVNPFF